MSRRAVLGAGLGALALGACSGRAEARWVTVSPTWSELARRGFGVCAHPTFQSTAYRFTEDWVAALARMNVHYFRGLYVDGLPVVDQTMVAARDHRVKWGMLVCNDLDTTAVQIQQRIEHVAQNGADVCLFIEGVNEPNSVRGGGVPPPDWPERVVEIQRTIFLAVRSHPELARVTVVGPSLHAQEATPADYDRLRALGLDQWMDAAGLHSYPAGHYPAQSLDGRVDVVRQHFPKVPLWLTETGYTNALATAQGTQPVPEDVVATYAPATLLEALDRKMRVAWYEALDEPDPGSKDVSENNYGLFDVGPSGAPPWRGKPAVDSMAAFLALLKDPGPPYRPPPVRIKVASQVDDLRWTALGKRDGSTWLHVRRTLDLWDPVAQVATPVPDTSVTVQTPDRRRTVDVGAAVVSIRL